MAFGIGLSHWKNDIMNTTVTLDKAGRVVIPKPLRDELHLEAGDRMELESEGESVTLRPVRTASPLRKEHGVWVFRSDRKIASAATDKVLRDLRDQRDVGNSGMRP
jgi:AbrB family looped-hinge helix DNA binding protein